MKIVISLGLFVLFQHAKWGACMNHSLGFPQGKLYNLHGKEDEKWSLSRLTNVADRIALLLREDPPYGIIGEALSKGLGTGGKSPTVSQLVDYEVPFIALASLSLLAALVIPVVGLIFCCCRFLGKCGGHVVDHDEIKRHPTKERIAYSIGIIICVVFLL
ncbi:PREDICTED: prominin-2-like [Acropora digitifera]|uniref:prominin-2-like n=1 Tax=Acropora digitifera TaxID=70779 RepID=UPI00077A2BB3|nr:PREDICTED: prominin-2-like [Acropora digitifera]